MGMFNFALDSIKGEIFDFKVKRWVFVASTVYTAIYTWLNTVFQDLLSTVQKLNPWTISKVSVYLLSICCLLIVNLLKIFYLFSIFYLYLLSIYVLSIFYLLYWTQTDTKVTFHPTTQGGKDYPSMMIFLNCLSVFFFLSVCLLFLFVGCFLFFLSICLFFFFYLCFFYLSFFFLSVCFFS